jgi:hypothetical protein
VVIACVSFGLQVIALREINVHMSTVVRGKLDCVFSILMEHASMVIGAKISINKTKNIRMINSLAYVTRIILYIVLY